MLFLTFLEPMCLTKWSKDLSVDGPMVFIQMLILELANCSHMAWLLATQFEQERADQWFSKANLLDPAAQYPVFTTPCGYIGEQSGHTLSCGHGCLGQIAIGQNATEKANMPMRQAFLYCTALGIPGHFKPQGRQRCIKGNAEVYQLTYKICKAGNNIFEHPEKFTAVLKPRLEILEFVVESYLYTELIIGLSSEWHQVSLHSWVCSAFPCTSSNR